MNQASKFRCVIHGSFRKHFDLIQRVQQIFSAAGIEVLAPRMGEVVSVDEGFAVFEGEEELDQRLIELMYLQNLKKLGEWGFSYFVNPGGYLGKSASYELGIAQLSNTRCFYYSNLDDHPAYVHKNAVWQPEDLAEFILKYDDLPKPQVRRSEKVIHQLWQELMVPGSVVAVVAVVAVGAIMEHRPNQAKRAEVLLVRTHKWGNLYSIVGGKVRQNERLSQALIREVKEETGLSSEVGTHLCTFDQIKNSGYYKPGIQHIFVDNVVSVTSKRVKLNEEAQDYVWMPVEEALGNLEIEPNAKHTLQLYADLRVR